ncbi:30S ribosome assembly GTPase [Spiroplasma sp. NBRC 100390]|uniref:ribosome biogenesis GTPase YqeH n=1 Tax=unclassified Spiroplasma TaxID=2637901 RepID=UPI0008929673|nr:MULTISPECIES: ribosome biogenesis GTPase YqeH [unclassified Spiroplasma]AOX43839.1 30S ribosome assembly GTPase [Spiroplasma sp. TU-14]APE13309.1 30S ribosome assembly GTPase [Spiroplasma sp. NBRC 100390]
MISYKKCQGCGAILQNTKQGQIGYVENLTQDYCYRCFRLTHYNELIDYDLNETDFLANLNNNYDLTYHYFYVLDVYDLDGSRNLELEQILQNNKVTLIINKIDLIQKLISNNKILTFVEELFTNSVLLPRIENIILVSALKNYSLDELYRYIKHQSEDIVFVGSSNTGKSTLLNSLIKLTNYQQKITVSNNVSTTLGNIEVKLGTRHKIYDTPGIVNNHTIISYLDHNDKKMITNKLIKPITFQLDSEQTIFYEGLASFSFLKGLKTSFHFYKNNNIKLHRTKLINKDHYFNQHLMQASLRLKDYHLWREQTIIIEEPGDYSLLIAGLGWITFKGSPGQEIMVGTNQNIKINLRKRFI